MNLQAQCDRAVAQPAVNSESAGCGLSSDGGFMGSNRTSSLLQDTSPISFFFVWARYSIVFTGSAVVLPKKQKKKQTEFHIASLAIICFVKLRLGLFVIQTRFCLCGHKLKPILYFSVRVLPWAINTMVGTWERQRCILRWVRCIVQPNLPWAAVVVIVATLQNVLFRVTNKSRWHSCFLRTFKLSRAWHDLVMCGDCHCSLQAF